MIRGSRIVGISGQPWQVHSHTALGQIFNATHAVIIRMHLLPYLCKMGLQCMWVIYFSAISLWTSCHLIALPQWYMLLATAPCSRIQLRLHTMHGIRIGMVLHLCT